MVLGAPVFCTMAMPRARVKEAKTKQHASLSIGVIGKLCSYCKGNKYNLSLSPPHFSSPSIYSYTPTRLTDDELVILGEVVLRDLEVQRRRSFPDTARDVVVRAVAGAKPSTVLASLADGHATQMGADAYAVMCVSPSILYHMRISPKTTIFGGSTSAFDAVEIRAKSAKLTQHDQPLRSLDTVLIGLGVP